MNWYRFKIELFGVGWKTFLCVLTVVLFLQTNLHYKPGTFMLVPVEYSFLVTHSWLIPLVLWSFVAFLWLAYFRAFRILRADRRYGER